MKLDLDLILSYTKQNGECLEWIRCFNTDGYPRALINGNNNAKVHRYVFELFNGIKLDNKVVRHTCDNPKCLNPKHLISGSNVDNIRDRDIRGRHGKAKLNHNQVLEIRKRFSEDNITQKELALEFNMSYRTINSIINRTHWRHI